MVAAYLADVAAIVVEKCRLNEFSDAAPVVDFDGFSHVPMLVRHGDMHQDRTAFGVCDSEVCAVVAGVAPSNIDRADSTAELVNGKLALNEGPRDRDHDEHGREGSDSDQEGLLSLRPFRRCNGEDAKNKNRHD